MWLAWWRWQESLLEQVVFGWRECKQCLLYAEEIRGDKWRSYDSIQLVALNYNLSLRNYLYNKRQCDFVGLSGFQPAKNPVCNRSIALYRNIALDDLCTFVGFSARAEPGLQTAPEPSK